MLTFLNEKLFKWIITMNFKQPEFNFKALLSYGYHLGSPSKKRSLNLSYICSGFLIYLILKH